MRIMIVNQEALEVRAKTLEAEGFNGIKLVLVELQPDPDPTEAILTVYFYNSLHVEAIYNDINGGVSLAREIFPIYGGHRLPAGLLTDQVQVVSVTQDGDPTRLQLTVHPIGDYSTYTLGLVYANIDPFLSEIDFKFRPGCFNLCKPDWDPPPAPIADPAIDYLAKDYDSFRHTIISWMMDKVPNWQATSEADLDQVLLELFSASADELSDYQDRVMNEDYLSTARKRVSLARHARLMDYHIHQGNQASTWLALEVNSSLTLPARFQVGIAPDLDDPQSVVFMGREVRLLDPLLNSIQFYTWDDSVPALEAGSVQADLIIDDGTLLKTESVRDWIQDGDVTHLLIQEHLNPRTGLEPGRNPTHRQLLQLRAGEAGAEIIQDPLHGLWLLRVTWEEQDKLQRNYCFSVECESTYVHDVSLFHANLVPVFHGRKAEAHFFEPGTVLAILGDEYHFTRNADEGCEVICMIPERPLAYRNTQPGGEVETQSTLEIQVEVDTVFEDWEEHSSLVHSDDGSEQGDHFVVETDGMGQSYIRFGNGINGRKLPQDAIVHCFYQVGRGLDGNIGADVLTVYNEAAFPEIKNCWNPFDVTDGRAPEPVDEIIRRVPEAYRHRQLRAVTLQDYVDRAEELPEIARAAAKYMWTGSWRTVRIAVDPVGTSEWNEDLERKLARHLEAVHLIGDDLEIRPPRYVPLDIVIELCVHPDYWPQDVRYLLEQEFSDGYTADGRMAFFHPDLWTFGQALHRSQLAGRIQGVKGVDHVLLITLKRWNAATVGTEDVLEVQSNEIILVKNDPDHKELGMISFDPKGGRQ